MEGKLGKRIKVSLSHNEEVKVVGPEPETTTHFDGRKGLTITSTTFDVVPARQDDRPLNILPGIHYNIMPQDGIRPTEVRAFKKDGRMVEVVSVLIFPSEEAVPQRNTQK